tara:strand:+ start:405 stop:938 length:534 start_codon:yes stop_codon:yes gene_type:complete
MVCEKCDYLDSNESKIFEKKLCTICSRFAPKEKEKFNDYISEKMDWKILETFRKNNSSSRQSQKEGMDKKASEGDLVTRPPKGYEVIAGKLIPNKDASKIHSLFRTFINRNYSLNSLARNFTLSTNGVKKILTNRTYLGEIKFNGKIHKGNHQAIISPEIFYETQRKLKSYLKPRKK